MTNSISDFDKPIKITHRANRSNKEYKMCFILFYFSRSFPCMYQTKLYAGNMKYICRLIYFPSSQGCLLQNSQIPGLFPACI